MMKEQAMPDDVLMAVIYLAFCDKDKITDFRYDRQEWSEFFHEQRRSYDVLRVFGFRESPLFPESATLNQAHLNLCATGLISSTSMKPTTYSIENGFEEAYKNLALPKFSEKELRDLKEIASAFRNNFSLELIVN